MRPTSIRRALAAAVLAVLVLPASGQDDKRPYFSLESNRTYAPGEKPTVQLWAQNVDALEFRVYKVDDPVAFFRKLEDVHGFGGRAPRLPMELTWLEKFHEWKREMRADIRDVFRAQFSAESREKIRDWWAEREKEPVKGPQPTQYAQVPVLNQQQLVSRWRQPISKTSRTWESQTVPIDAPGKGLYLVEAVHSDLRAYTIINVTELGITVKTAPGRVLAFVQNRTSGVPVADSALLVWTNKKEAASAKTDAQGLAQASVKEREPEDTLVLARTKDDFAVASPYGWYLSSDPDRYWVGYIYTDRPVYRPGHTVYLKGILRTQLGAQYRLPEVREVEVTIQDPEDNTVYRKTLPLSPNGTLQGEYSVPGTAPLGYYSITVRSGEAEEHGGFNVEEYKKPEYEVRVTPAESRVLQGQSIRATIEARYYFGEPVAGAKVTWVVHTSRYWFPLYAGDDEEVSDEGEEGGYYYGSEQIDEQEGRLDADGKLAITVPTRVQDRKWDVRYRIEARVTDAANREIAGRNSALATYGSFLVRIQPQQYVFKPGERARFIVEARDYDAKPVATPVRVELFRWTWKEPLGAPLATTEARTDATGEAKAELPLRESGSFLARVTARTPEGRDVENRAYVWVEGTATWYDERRERVQIVPDKKSYRPGEVARVLIVTGVPEAHVLVTTEGRELHSKQVVHATGSTVTVDVPVLPEYAPNFFVGVAFLRDNQFYQGSKKIKVPPTEHQLTVEVASSKKEYKPGELALFTVTARDAAGKPVPAAEISLGVVDEAIYAIRPEGAPDILRSFYGDAYNRVNTSTSLSYYFHGASGKRPMQLAGGGSGGGGAPRSDLAQVKPERMVEPRVRKAFPDTTFWAAALTTDSAGRAQARFSFPDSLTTWRATARAITRDTKVGSAIQRTVVRKNLILRLAVPRFFTEGDEVTISVLVHNYLATDKKTRVSLALEGLDVVDGAAKDVAVPSRGDAKVDWRVRAKSVREAKLLGKALTDEESDAMELTLPVIPYGVKLSEARAGALHTAEFETELVVPQQSVPTSRAIEVSVAPSIGGALFGALDYLTTYPYGCTEQTMSSFLPNVVVARAMKDLGLKSNVNEAELTKKVRAGLDRLYTFQHEDGGWGWWQTDESGAFMTAYVLAGLAQAQEAGYQVRPYDMSRARAWLRKAFDDEKRALPDLRAYLAYALVLARTRDEQGKLAPASADDRAVLDAVWARRSDITSYGLALLGLALEAAGDARAGEIAAQLESAAKQDEREAYWPGDRDTLMDFYGDVGPEATAYAVKLLSHLRPKSPLLPKAALWLMAHRNEGYYWYSTKQTAMVVYGLTDYLKTSGELKPNFTATVSVNGKSVLTRKFTEADALAPGAPSFRLPADQVFAGSNKIKISRSGEGRLYWSARAEYYSTEEKLQRTGTVALNLLRDYFKLIPERTGEKIVYRLEPLSGPLAPGDVLAVRLTVTGGNWRYLMVEDPIPAGTEFIERDDLYELKDRPPWWRYWFARRELHDDRVAIFETYFYRGQTQHFYLLKVVNPGTFRVSPARVLPMYQPQYLATTESKIVEVK